jgi:hypothetical protein
MYAQYCMRATRLAGYLWHAYWACLRLCVWRDVVGIYTEAEFALHDARGTPSPPATA